MRSIYQYETAASVLTQVVCRQQTAKRLMKLHDVAPTVVCCMGSNFEPCLGEWAAKGQS